MARRISPSDLRRRMREAGRKRKQAVNKINQAIRRYNQDVNRAVNNYNHEVCAHNARVRANRQRLRSELTRLRSRPATMRRFVEYRSSVQTLHQAYVRLEHREETRQLGPNYYRVLDLSERETANSIEVANRLVGGADYTSEPDAAPEDADLLDRLRWISTDLDDRWRGAVFALNPRNPDAARHFCTSARELFTAILEMRAPDADVLRLLPNVARTDLGKPTRREKIKYLLHRRGLPEQTLEEFVEQDMANIVELFGMFNDGTHGSAGTFDLKQLAAIKKRVENGLFFLAEISGATDVRRVD